MFDIQPYQQNRAIAFYLPQFHPVPENDSFWGPGFTEWRNVVQARPRFPGHEQPHLPGKLGFYDLRLPETRAMQAELARKAGLSGFCYYHYWFSGKRVLHRPFDEVLASGEPDFPFMLCWANENWTRAWDGGQGNILLAQDYSDKDTEAHARHLVPAFSDPRYIRIDRKPVFAVYHCEDLPCPRRWSDRFRDTLARYGIDVYLIRVERYLDKETGPPAKLGFDAALEFQPFSRNFRRWLSARPDLKNSLSRRVLQKIRQGIGQFRGLDRHYDMSAFVAFDTCQPQPDYTCFPGVCPSWDNSARRPPGKGIIFRNSSPDLFSSWLAAKSRSFSPPSQDENLIFVNAWNEWAEGNHLEPCLRYEDNWLKAMRAGLGSQLVPDGEIR